VDNLVAYAAPVGKETFPDVPGSDAPALPEGLLPKMGVAGKYAYFNDINVGSFFFLVLFLLLLLFSMGSAGLSVVIW
jgi:hypothetical protein